MNKLSNNKIDKLLKCSPMELNMFLHFVCVQNEWGQVENLTYKNVKEELNFKSNTTFYNCLNGLESKGLIRIVNAYSNNWGYYDLEILDNVFRNKEDLKNGYINLNLNLFVDKDYINATVNVKVFVIKLIVKLSKLKAVYFNVEQIKFILGITTNKVAKVVIEAVKKWFKVVKNGDTYIISKKEEFFIAVGEAAESKSIVYRITNFLSRFGISFIDADIKELIIMFKQFSRSWSNLLYALWECKRYGTVQLKLVNKILNKHKCLIK